MTTAPGWAPDTFGSKGYKQSDLGVIPDDWEVAPLAQLFDFRNGVNADKTAYGTGIRFINVLEVITNSHLEAEQIPGRVSISDAAERAYLVRPGDVVFNRTSETQEEVGLAAVYIGGEPVVFGGFVIRGRPLDSRLDSTFAGYVLRAHAVRRQIVKRGQGAIRSNIGQADLRQVFVPLPPIGEQRAIASALVDVDASLDAIGQLIDKKRAMKSGVMQQLLAGATRLPGFSGEWELIRLGDVLTFLSTASNPRADLSDEGEIAYLHYGDIHGHESPVLDFTATRLPRIAARKVAARSRLADGDLVLVDASEDLEGVGTSVEIANLGAEPAVAGLHTILCRGHRDGWAPGFKAYLQYLPAFRQSLRRVATGTSVYGISKQQVAEIEVRLPSAVEQEAITSVLAAVECEIDATVRQHRKLRSIKAGMNFELLSGRTRLRSRGAE